ncbi:MAG: hypothetical protein K2P65_09385 [Lachnospiraceae bacterium]|nr:hypothetical protein [Lachnospiraceae bacterium]
MKIYDFTLPELECYKEFCNFTPEEEKLFNLRSSGLSQDECCGIMRMELSNIKRISQRVNAKISFVSENVDVIKWIREKYS